MQREGGGTEERREERDGREENWLFNWPLSWAFVALRSCPKNGSSKPEQPFNKQYQYAGIIKFI